MSDRRYHLLKTSSSKNLLVADSQARHLDFPNFNILSLPGVRIGAVQNFLPEKDKFNIIALLIGGNDAFNGKDPSSIPAGDIAEELSKLAEELCEQAKKIFVIGIPHRSENRARSAKINEFLRKIKGTWKFRGVSEKIHSSYHLKTDELHLSEEGLKGIKSILKNKILYDKHSNICNTEGHLVYYECRFKNCQCPY